MTLHSLFSLVICPAGTMSREEACSLCPQGTYQNQEGRDFCSKCPRGSSHAGASSVNQCEYMSAPFLEVPAACVSELSSLSIYLFQV